MTVVIKGAALLGGKPADVLVEGETIAAVGGNLDGDERIDGTGLVLLPRLA
jgi:dihydroorotase